MIIWTLTIETVARVKVASEHNLVKNYEFLIGVPENVLASIGNFFNHDYLS